MKRILFVFVLTVMLVLTAFAVSAEDFDFNNEAQVTELIAYLESQAPEAGDEYIDVSDFKIRAADELKKLYPEAVCSLEAADPFQLLVATRLSAQCTDARVNLVTPALFGKYPTIEAFAQADVHDVEALIHSCGFFRQKAKDIVGMANDVLSRFGGRVPDTIEELTTLPGVGRKTANLIVGDVYGKPAVVADTHLIRISNRLGLVETKDPLKVELALKELLPPEESNDFCHRAVLHGRALCDARRPLCADCPLNTFCKFSKEQ